MDQKTRAKLVLLQVKAIQDGNYENRTSDLLTLINEVIRDAEALAEAVNSEPQEDEIKKTA